MDNLDNIQPYSIEQIPENPGQPTETEPVKVEKTTFLTRSKRTPFIAFIIGFIVIGLIIFGYLLIKANQSSTKDNNTNTNTNNNSSDDDTDTTDTTKKIVLQWWGVFLDEDVVQPLIDQYQAEHTNVTIQYANKTDGASNSTSGLSSYKTELNRVLKSNDSVQQPDIFMVDNSWVGDYEIYSRASTTYNQTTFANTFYPAISTDLAATGQVYGIPMWMDSLAIIYNKNILGQKSVTTPPSSWPEFQTLAKSLTTVTNNTYTQEGFSAGTSENVSFGYDLLNLLMLQNGVKMNDTTTLTPTFADNITAALTALQFYQGFASGSNASWNSSLPNDSAEFLNGKLAMTAVSSWRLRDILTYNDKNSLGLNIGIAQVPQLVGQGSDLINFANYWASMVTLNRPNSDAAWEFLNWLSQAEQYKTLSDNIKSKYGYFGIVSPRKDMSTDMASDTYLQVFNQSAPYAQSWYTVKGDEVVVRFNAMIDTSASSSSLISAQDDIKKLVADKGIL